MMTTSWWSFVESWEGMTEMPTLDAVSRAITDENLDDLTTTAWYGGINYWAASCVIPALGMGWWFDLYDHEDGAVEENDADRFRLNGKMLKRAFWQILEGEIQVARYIQEYFLRAWLERDDEGIDMGHIDAEAADVWVQVAAFGRVIYG